MKERERERERERGREGEKERESFEMQVGRVVMPTCVWNASLSFECHWAINHYLEVCRICCFSVPSFTSAS